ncbi:MAG: 3-isopropylmalate dehydratase small subunit [Candidatus Dormibacteraceae bacterium]
MKAFRQHSGTLLPLNRAHVDTDQIIPKQFLKRIERSGFGPFLFYDWKREDPNFILNRKEYAGASILVAGANFGCGSSREHAPWSLVDAGFRVIIAPSFADIFCNNCAKIGLLTVQLPPESVARLIELGESDPEARVTIDLEREAVNSIGMEESFKLDPFVRECLLNGWDGISLTLRHQDAITNFEARRPSFLPTAY